MIVYLGASAILLAALQAGINAPRDAFRECLKATTAKATAEKVDASAYEAYLQSNCEAQAKSFRAASISFDVKNGISRKEASAGVDEMIADWMASSVENYAWRAERSASPAPKAAATPQATTATPAAATKPAQ